MAAVVAEVMTTDPQMVDVHDPIRAAAQRMRDAGSGDVLVCEGERLVGILTDRDIVVRCVAEGGGPGTEAGDVCSGDDLVTVSPQTSIEEAVSLMSANAVRRLPMVDGERPIGVVSLGDLAIERDPSSALGQISAARGNV